MVLVSAVVGGCKTVAVIDLGTEDPEVAGILSRGLAIIDGVVSSLHNEVLAIQEPPMRSELLRLVTDLPRGPLDVSGAIAVALANARGSLEHISYLVQNPVPTSPIVLQALLRAALVGSARTLYILLPQDPQIRLERGRAILAEDCESGRQGLEKFAAFEGLKVFAAPDELAEAVSNQRKQLWPKGNPPGDGKIIEGMTHSLVDALELAGLSEEFGPETLRDHSNWLWNARPGPRIYGRGCCGGSARTVDYRATFPSTSTKSRQRPTSRCSRR